MISLCCVVFVCWCHQIKLKLFQDYQNTYQTILSCQTNNNEKSDDVYKTSTKRLKWIWYLKVMLMSFVHGIWSVEHDKCLSQSMLRILLMQQLMIRQSLMTSLHATKHAFTRINMCACTFVCAGVCAITVAVLSGAKTFLFAAKKTKEQIHECWSCVWARAQNVSLLKSCIRQFGQWLRVCLWVYLS